MIDPADIALIKRQIEAQLGDYEKAVAEYAAWYAQWKARQRAAQAEQRPEQAAAE